MRITNLCTLGLMGIAATCASAQMAATHRVVLEEGAAAPGFAGGTVFALSPPRLNALGDLVFGSVVRPTPTTTARAIYGEREGVLRRVAWTGMQVPGLSAGITLTPPNDYDAIKIDSMGNAFFAATVAGPGVNTNNDQVLMRERGGALELVLREGNPAPGLAGLVLFDGFANLSINGSGKVAFTTKLAGVGVTLSSDDVVYVEGSSGFIPLREGWPAPGVANTELAVLANVTSLSDDGTIALTANAQGTSGSRSGLLVLSEEGYEFLVLTGEPSPLTGYLYGGFMYSPVLTPKGTLVFQSSLDGPGVNASSNEITLIGSTRELEILIRERDPVPGYPEGTLLDGLAGVARLPMVNDRGELAARMNIKVPPLYHTEEVWFTNIGGAFRPLALQGAVVPRLGPEITLGNPQIHRAWPGGKIVVRSLMNGPGVTDANNECVFAGAVEGDLYPVLREGGSITLGSGVQRTVQQISSMADWLRPSFNAYSDSERMGFLVTFAGGIDAVLVATVLYDCSACAADFDANGGVDGGDIAAFITKYEAGNSCADVNRDGGVDGADVGAFFQLFEAGGC